MGIPCCPDDIYSRPVRDFAEYPDPTTGGIFGRSGPYGCGPPGLLHVGQEKEILIQTAD